MSNNYEVIKQAIINKSSMSLTYKDCHREVSPHVIGTNKGGKRALFYQFGGESNSEVIYPNSTSNWRCMIVDEITNLKVTDKAWQTAENNVNPPNCVDTVDVKAKY